MIAVVARVTKTGGRDATTRPIAPKLALAVGKPAAPAPRGWQWSALTDLARLESGHTPSRKYREYWGGDVPWISIQDAKAHHGRRISQTIESTNALGIGNSSARVLPANTVCLSRTASVGYVVIMDRPMATSQDFVNWVCSGDLDPEFLQYLFIAEGDDLLRFASGAVHQTIYFPEAKAFHICHPGIPEQRRIVAVLDRAFESIAIARENAEKNLQNARELFRSQLRSIFSHTERQGPTGPPSKSVPKLTVDARGKTVGKVSRADLKRDPGATKTGGREATVRHIPGELSLSVCMPVTPAKPGWRWRVLTDLARLESGHTPSRKHPEYWGGSIPWIGIQDAREHHGQRITDTEQHTNVLGIENSSARVLPAETVCLSRTASVGYVVVMSRPMATSQDFVNWVCSDELLADFLKYIFLAEGRDGLLRYASGSVHQTIYFPEAKAFCVCHPDISEQDRIIRLCDATRAETQRLESIYQRKLAALDELKQSLLHEAFTGKL
ncbi:MAG TPA: restriction endonuclease subunit S [Steroidobacteraceae bacterium]|nr:restriction endonuclease subunit S [Steroidobacteraceae bacterium]